VRESALDLDPAVKRTARSHQCPEQPERRNQWCGTEIPDGRMHIIALEFGAPVDPAERAQLGVALQLEAVIIRLAVEELEHRQVVPNLAGEALKDEVRETFVIEIGREMHRTVGVVKAELSGIAFLLLEVRIADFERLVAAMRSVREQFIDEGRTFAVGQRHARPPAGRELILGAERTRQGREMVRLVKRLGLFVGPGGKMAELDPCTAFESEGTGYVSLQREEAGLLLPTGRQEDFLADDRRVAIEILEAAGPAPARLFRLDQFEAALAALASEVGADLAVRFQLIVEIFRIAAAGLDLAEEAADRDFGAGIVARLMRCKGRLFELAPGLETVADRHLVSRRVARHRDSDVEIAVDISDAERPLGRPRAGMGQSALEVGERLDVGITAGQRLGAKLLRQDMTANVEIARLVVIPVRVKDEMPADR
jgi:hypothetical protein